MLTCHSRLINALPAHLQFTLDAPTSDRRDNSNNFPSAQLTGPTHLVAVWNFEAQSVELYINGEAAVQRNSFSVLSYPMTSNAYLLFGLQKCANNTGILPSLGPCTFGESIALNAPSCAGRRPCRPCA
jgi:hypothetical protein